MLLSLHRRIPSSIRWGRIFIQTVRHNSSLTSSQIQNIQQFLEYAAKNGLDSKSTVFNGTIYELYVKQFLEKGFHCTEMIKVGGKGDEGVDLIGKWDLSYFHKKSIELFPGSKPGDESILNRVTPTNESNSDLSDINVLVQCKNSKSKLKPNLIKELTGIFYFHRHDPKNTFMFIVSPHLLTTAALRSFEATDCPMIHIQVSSLYNHTDDVYDLTKYHGGIFSGLYLNTSARKLLSGIRIQDLLGDKMFHGKDKLRASLLS
ncbi:RRG7 [[Candida] subhashii]|uniref:Required for respiratory growth protein 7, mitochondrial n=1 Tax=[Candida] subhashii TaxID=561895 RepID=A0A8J5QCM7_9ASCO|nr:RRG7 [[Candida] subhashii]KAG7663794.1 RRG7 [[Candida] subhashii]